MKSKKHLFLIWSFILFFAGLLISLTINEYTKNYDKYHWLILLPIVLPLAGTIFGIIGIGRVQGFTKLIPLLCVLANIGLAVVIFLAYSFSYWQF